MPVTHIFKGIAFCRIPDGSVNLSGFGDTAEITFKDNTEKEKAVTIKVYLLSELQETELFKDAAEMGIELLVSTWQTKKIENTLIKYCPEQELAFTFTSDSEVEHDFLKLIESRVAQVLSYFHELSSLKRLNRANISLELLRETPGVDEQKIKLILNHLPNYIKLLELHFTPRHVGLMEYESFQKYLKEHTDLKDALNYVTIEQVLGLSHNKPRALCVEKKEPQFMVYQHSTSTHGEFRACSSDNEITITHTNNARLAIRWYPATDDAVSKINTQLSSLDLEELTHDWYTRTKNEGMWIIRYCPKLRCIISESHDPTFPKKQFNVSIMSEMLCSPYHIEKKFVGFLTKNGASMSDLRMLPGMTEYKLKVLREHSDAVSTLLNEGMTFEKLARVDANRLEHLLGNFLRQAHLALKFVDPDELFGLCDTTSTHTHGFFPPPIVRSDIADGHWSPCALL